MDLYYNDKQLNIQDEFDEDSQIFNEASVIALQNSVESLFSSNNKVKDTLARFNNDIDKAIDFQKDELDHNKKKLNSNNVKLVHYSNEIVKDSKLLEKTTDPIERKNLQTRIDYHFGEINKISDKNDLLKKNIAKNKGIIEELSSIKKDSLKRKILNGEKLSRLISQNTLKIASKGFDNLKVATSKTINIASNSIINTTEKAFETSNDMVTDSTSSAASQIPYVGPVLSGTVKGAGTLVKGSARATATSSKALVYAADKTAMAASKAMKESIKLTTIQNKILKADDPYEAVKTVGQTGVNLGVSTVSNVGMKALSTAAKDLFALLNPALLIRKLSLGNAIVSLIMIMVMIFFVISLANNFMGAIVSYVENYIDIISRETDSNSKMYSNYGSGNALAEFALNEYEASFVTQSDGTVRQMTENDGVQNKYIDKYSEIGHVTFGYSAPWCAMFVSYCCDGVGLVDNGTFIPRSYCPDIKNDFISNDLYHLSSDGYMPKKGDLLLYDWQNDGVVDHVGIVVDVSDTSFTTIEGNSGSKSDRIEKRDRSIDDSSIDGYCEMPFPSSENNTYLTDDELLDFAAVIAGEAGNTEEGTLAVATVIMHRYEGKGGYSSYSYSSIYEVTHAANQFAAINDKTYTQIMDGTVDISSYPNAYQAAVDVLNGARSDLIPEDCVSFRTDSSSVRNKYPNGISIDGNWFFW